MSCTAEFCPHLRGVTQLIDTCREQWYEVAQSITDTIGNPSAFNEWEREIPSCSPEQIQSRWDNTHILLERIEETLSEQPCIQMSPFYQRYVQQRVRKLAWTSLVQSTIASMRWWESKIESCDSTEPQLIEAARSNHKRIQHIAREMWPKVAAATQRIVGEDVEKDLAVSEFLKLITIEEQERQDRVLQYYVAKQFLLMNLDHQPLSKEVVAMKMAQWNLTSKIQEVSCLNPLSDPPLESHEVITYGAQVGPYQIYYTAVQGERENMEDRATLGHTQLKGGEEITLFGVYDGHAGDQTANWLQSYLIPTLVQRLNGIDPCVDHQLINTLKTLGPHINELLFALNANPELHPSLKPGFSGSTAVLAFVFRGTLFVCNIGDSQAVLINGNKAVALTVDARAKTPSYRRPLAPRGGTYEQQRGHGIRVYAGVEYGLEPARRIGPKDYGVSSRAKISFVELAQLDWNQPIQLLLYSDGIVEEMSQEQLLEYACRTQDLQRSVTNLTKHALQREEGGREFSSSDNCTLIGVSLNTPS